MRKIVVFVSIFFFSAGVSFALETSILIVYTGNSFSSLYPCGHCPATVGGGIAYRAKFIKDLRVKHNILLLDSGNIFPLGKFSNLNKEKQVEGRGYDLVETLNRRQNAEK